MKKQEFVEEQNNNNNNNNAKGNRKTKVSGQELKNRLNSGDIPLN